jgi:hypothetical protein
MSFFIFFSRVDRAVDATAGNASGQKMVAAALLQLVIQLSDKTPCQSEITPSSASSDERP